MKLTAELVDDCITLEQYYVFPGTTTTVCHLTLNGRVGVIGMSDCINPEEFDIQKGRVMARRKAVTEAFVALATAMKLGASV